MKKILFLILLILILVGCSVQNLKKEQTPAPVQQEQVVQVEKPLCKNPYFEYKRGDCCLDTNGNGICDTDELIKEETSVISVDKTTENITELSQTDDSKILQNLLNEFMTKHEVYWWVSSDVGLTSENSKVFAKEELKSNIRHIYFQLTRFEKYSEYSTFENPAGINVFLTDVYLNMADKTGYATCEAGKGTLCEPLINTKLTLNPKGYEYFMDLFKSPTYWMLKFKDEIPIRVDRSPQMVNTGRQTTVSPILYFENKGITDATGKGMIIGIMIDTTNKIPVRIETYQVFGLRSGVINYLVEFKPVFME